MMIDKCWWKLFASALLLFSLFTGTALAAGLQEFALVTEEEGWLLLEQHLYWTTTTGDSWIDITPPNLERAIIWAVTFSDVQHGCLVFTDADEAGNPRYGFARTSDSGATWQQIPLTMLYPVNPDSMFGAIYLYFLDAERGWMVLKHQSSSNFSVGALFSTTDGGNTWEECSIPIGEPVFFVTPEIGWIAGGAAGDELYRTSDSGRTWTAQTVGSQKRRLFYHLPTFDTAQDGVLPVVLVEEYEKRAQFYRTADGGNSWALVSEILLDQNIDPQVSLPLSVLNADSWLMVTPNTTQLLNARTTQRSSDGKTARIQTLKMVSAETGWGKYATGSCATSPKGKIECTSDIRLLRTTDGGYTWTPVNVPQTDGTTADRLLMTYPVRSSTDVSRTSQMFVGQGFDKCEVPSLSQLQAWKDGSPYDEVVNLYFGGACRSCPNPGLNASYVSQMAQQGWKFILTWVGRQSQCYSRCSSYKISHDTTTAYNQGIAEADLAIAAVVNLGLSDTIIYYDIEAYNLTATTDCRNAAKSFINGWTARLQSQGYQSGVYTSSGGGHIADYASIANVPDAIWPAAWYWPLGVGNYKSDASVFSVSSLDDSLWASHQRIRQYAGEITETWGNVAMNIDPDVIDGPVTVAGLCGSLSGTLNAGTYTLGCDIYVNSGVSLHLMPGVILNYNGHSFTVNGELIWGP